jgi:hypothetical protein
MTEASMGRFFFSSGSPLSDQGAPPSPDAVYAFVAACSQHGYWLGSPSENEAIGLMVGPS